ncbi:hypothetical protein [Vitiosangium sp. GDMCC 1.1324]|uniref:hypothetical protein n=1 Tax=Vitiosangium sp. (strain GDMCC 1.1324) TaxID=2138576 RepID=UPI00130EB7AB|nr:hypothetical protein [Vitiosangium sp. GDMCC 1.1324]
MAEPNIGAWRRAVTGDLLTTLDFKTPDAQWPQLPDTSDSMHRVDLSCQLATPMPPKKQALPRQEPGQRPARALPYQLQVDG